MKEEKEIQYVKRTQKDYSYVFKLSVIKEIEIKAAARKYGIQAASTVSTW